MDYLHKCFRAKKSMALSNHKQIEKLNTVNTSIEEETLYGLQAKDHSLQPGSIERKRVSSVIKENTQCKCIKIADGIKQKRVCTVSKNEESLSGKKKLSKPERQIEAAKAFQEEMFSKMAVHQLFQLMYTQAEMSAAVQAEQIGAYKYLSNHRNSKPVCINQGFLKLREETSHETFKQFPHPAPLPRIPLCPELTEEFQDPPRNLETRSGLFAKPNGYTAYRN